MQKRIIFLASFLITLIHPICAMDHGLESMKEPLLDNLFKWQLKKILIVGKNAKKIARDFAIVGVDVIGHEEKDTLPSIVCDKEYITIERTNVTSLLAAMNLELQLRIFDIYSNSLQRHYHETMDSSSSEAIIIKKQEKHANSLQVFTPNSHSSSDNLVTSPDMPSLIKRKTKTRNKSKKRKHQASKQKHRSTSYRYNYDRYNFKYF